MKKFLKFVLPYIIILILGLAALDLLLTNKKYERETKKNEAKIEKTNKIHKSFV